MSLSLSARPTTVLALLTALVAGAAVGCGDNWEMGKGPEPTGGCGGVMGTGGAETGGAGTGGAPGSGGAPANFFTVVALPDTQYYAALYPEIFELQVKWILDQREARRIAFVLHEGDIVNQDIAPEWEVASRALHKLDGLVPYVLAAGNHDYLASGGIDDRTGTLINQYFPLAPLAASPGFRGSFAPDRVENTAQFLMMGAMPWLVISLEFGPRDAVLAWADGIVKQYPDMPAMIVTHAYQSWDGTRYDHVAKPSFDQQPYNPWQYSANPPPGGVNDGEEMWRKLIRDNESIRFVINGHTFNPNTGNAAATLTSTHPSGAPVHQIVANYQETALGGAGYLRVMQFCPDEHELRVSTYSPYLDSWKQDAANVFTLPL
jgi:hypothetical protein